MTIYEKESLFESLDETYAEIKAYVEGAIAREELHEVELNLFRRVRIRKSGGVGRAGEISPLPDSASSPFWK